MLRASRAAGLHVYVEGGERRGRGGGKKNKGGEGGNRVARHLKVKTSKYIQCTERGKGKKKKKRGGEGGGGGERGGEGGMMLGGTGMFGGWKWVVSFRDTLNMSR